jgi:putative signal transducing protein
MGREMKELIRTNDAVLLTYIDAVLNDARIPHEVADEHMSGMEAFNMIYRRVMVLDEDYDAAKRLLNTATTELPYVVVEPDEPSAG